MPTNFPHTGPQPGVGRGMHDEVIKASDHYESRGRRNSSTARALLVARFVLATHNSCKAGWVRAVPGRPFPGSALMRCN